MSELLTQTDPALELLEVVQPELLVEVVTVREVIEANPDQLVERVVEQELLEVAQQGPPGPQGQQGPQGLPGLPGDANIGGLEIYVQNPEPGEYLRLDPTNTWVNAKPDQVLDGGNF